MRLPKSPLIAQWLALLAYLCGYAIMSVGPTWAHLSVLVVVAAVVWWHRMCMDAWRADRSALVNHRQASREIQDQIRTVLADPRHGAGPRNG